MAMVSMLLVMLLAVLCLLGVVAAVTGVILLSVWFGKKKKSKALLVLSIICFVIALPAVVIILFFIFVPESTSENQDSITMNGITYETGFYGDFHPVNVIREEEAFTFQENTFYPVEHEKFDFMHSSDETATHGAIGIDGGILYCNQEQLEDAKQYYENTDNYVVKCTYGLATRTFTPSNYELTDVLYEDYVALCDFSKQKHKQKEIVDISNSDDTVERVSFYAESVDGLFSSQKEKKYLIKDSTLYLLTARGGETGLGGVPVPDDISEPFLRALEQTYIPEREN